MKYNVGDKVRIKSLDWYNENKDEDGVVKISTNLFTPGMSQFCGKVMTIEDIFEDTDGDVMYYMKDIYCSWTDEMIEGLVEEETLIESVDNNGLPFNEWLSHKGAFHVPEDCVLKDENGNVINATKIVLEKKKNEYPKTYEECLNVLGYEDIATHCIFHNEADEKLFNTLYDLKVCRDAYWKIAGEEMGLGKPWEPDYTKDRYIICRFKDKILRGHRISGVIEHFILEFPTEEMRDAFKENFDTDIEFCKEFL